MTRLGHKLLVCGISRLLCNSIRPNCNTSRYLKQAWVMIQMLGHQRILIGPRVSRKGRGLILIVRRTCKETFTAMFGITKVMGSCRSETFHDVIVYVDAKVVHYNCSPEPRWFRISVHTFPPSSLEKTVITIVYKQSWQAHASLYGSWWRETPKQEYKCIVRLKSFFWRFVILR